jgi:hypothetical protein
LRRETINAAKTVAERECYLAEQTVQQIQYGKNFLAGKAQ